MADKCFTRSLTGKMVLRLLRGLSAGIFLIFFLYLGSSNFLQQYFFSSGYFYEQECERMRSFQKYVSANQLEASDSDQLRSWVQERNILEFTVSRGRWLLFDISIAGHIMSGSKEINRHTFKFYHTISFADGNADVCIYEGTDRKYYYLLLGISIFLGFLAFIGIFVTGMKEDVTYIQCLEQEVSLITQGNLQKTVTVKGQDELAQLALGLNIMREALHEKELIEKELRTAQEKLVLGMSHDLRTPLTGLFTYMEILRKQGQEGAVQKEYIDKAYDKIVQIKNLSDQMFEYFFIHSHEVITLEPPEEIASAFRDYLSEMCALLECSGFSVDAGRLEWRPVCVQVNTDYLGRIVNNILSNIEKYASPDAEVQIQIIYEPGQVGICIQNGIAAPDQYVEGTGLGIKNISFMMQQLAGKAVIHKTEHIYQIVLYFPLRDCCSKDCTYKI